MPPVHVSRRTAHQPLTAAESAAVLAAAATASDADGSAPLSEQFRLALEAREVDEVEHVLAHSDEAYAAEPAIVGYAQVRSGGVDEPPSAELFVTPDARRSGVGSALLDELPPDVRVWSHDGGAAAQGFASAHGLAPVRSLLVMRRSLMDGPGWPEADVPGSYLVRTFEPGRDETAWLEANAAAFADHPEQGSLDRADLDQRMTQPWFDPTGLILLVPHDDPDRIAAFHWTKVDPPDGSRGEVYVVGVGPDHQGQGLGKAVTVLGLTQLRDRGLVDVVLYVDEDNTVAVHTYRGLGFENLEVHRQFARPAAVPD